MQKRRQFVISCFLKAEKVSGTFFEDLRKWFCSEETLELCGLGVVRPDISSANLRKELPERVLELVNREGDRLQHAFAVLQPGRVRISTPPK